MTNDSLKQRSFTQRMARARSAGRMSIRVRDLAEAGARGVALTSLQIKEICEALRAQHHSVRNQFHSGN